jgi:hypothetical protein
MPPLALKLYSTFSRGAAQVLATSRVITRIVGAAFILMENPLSLINESLAKGFCGPDLSLHLRPKK